MRNRKSKKTRRGRVAACHTVQQAGKLLGISERTAYRRLAAKDREILKLLRGGQRLQRDSNNAHEIERLIQEIDGLIRSPAPLKKKHDLRP